MWFLALAVALNLAAALLWSLGIIGLVSITATLGPWIDYPAAGLGFVSLLVCFGIANVLLMRLAER